MRESEIEAYLVKRVKELGGEVRKLKWIGRRGAPDRFVMVFGRSFFVELKAPGKKLNEQQVREVASLRGQGADVWVCDSKDSIDGALALEEVRSRK